ncbi:MAG: precorrin-6y C5,15-methyltransferase (decarboxylating) subunit CbiE [Muribaculaceae bacterium]|nr:precorrin-6y C5,15-methyltransferase (decarboxylating) subunit CbiE [Muribaculaceae bacterium]
MKFYVIGISDAPRPYLPPEVISIICKGRIFSGGKRHYGLVAPYLPVGAEWIDITTPLDAVFEQYHDEVIVFASGDPLFFGFANTIRRKMPDAEIVLFPSFNSLQLLAHRLVMPYNDMRIVSLTGRPWPDFDRALIERAGKIGVLTDHEHTPAAIARRMLEYGYNGYEMYVGEHLGNPNEERISTWTLEQASEQTFDYPNCLILVGNDPRPRYFGIPESEFALLDGREKMITKAPIRLLTLQALELPQRSVLWDIGFCTGSVSIEARLQFPHLHIEAFEIRPECEALMQENSRRFGAPGINWNIGDFLEADIDTLPRPDAVFIGGHGGKLKEIMARVMTVLTDDGVIVMNSVTSPMVHTDSHQLFNEACQELGLTQCQSTRIILNDNNPIEILKCKKKF